MKVRQRPDKEHSSVVACLPMLRVKREAMKNPGLLSGEIFKAHRFAKCVEEYMMSPSEGNCPVSFSRIKACIGENTYGKETTMGKDNMKMNFCKVLITEETHATFDGPDGWNKG